MGKGDKKTKRGKILMGSHGVRRPRRKLEKTIPLKALKEEKPVTPAKEKAPVKPKIVKEDVLVEKTAIAIVPAEDALKPARKKAPPKGSAKKDVT